MSFFPKIHGNPKITFLRQETAKDKLSQYHRELDVPILFEWPNDEKAAVIFSLEHESNPYTFNPYRLAHYCLDLAKLNNTHRIVPIVVFVGKGKFKGNFNIGIDAFQALSFQFIACHLSGLNYRDWMDSDNIVARINLPNMSYPEEEKLYMRYKAISGLFELSNNHERHIKWLELIDKYGNIDDKDYEEFQKLYPEEGVQAMSYIQEMKMRSKQEGQQEGKQEGLLMGLITILQTQLQSRFGEVPPNINEKIERADMQELNRWLVNILEAETIEGVFV